MSDHLPAGVERMMHDASARGLDVEVVSRPPAGSLAEAAGLLGIQPREIIKSLVVKHKDGSFFFALIPGDRVISWPKLRSLLGVNKLSLPHSDVAFAATGYERGTITPLGSRTPWPVYADFGVEPGRICIGAGAHAHSALVDSTDLIAALDATVADISDPEPQVPTSS
jgi:prolyl-tRNA editing enzyme YbaK/EbsC (Cys-tRNA(Pro) deacylase)